MTKIQNVTLRPVWTLEIGICLEIGIWKLEFLSARGGEFRVVVQRQYLPLGWVRFGFNSRQPE